MGDADSYGLFYLNALLVVIITTTTTDLCIFRNLYSENVIVNFIEYIHACFIPS